MMGRSPEAQGPLASSENHWRADGPLQEFLLRKFIRHQGYLPNLASPNTFTEKLLHRMLFDRRRILTTFADKLTVRDHVKERLGGTQNLCTIHGVFSRAEDLNGFDFPSRFVLKANHGSGWNYIHHRGEFDRKVLIGLSRRWLNSNYGRSTGEWCYDGIERKVFCEEYLGTSDAVPIDYKFYCFSGTVRFITAHFDRHSGHKCNVYDRDWNLLKFRDPTLPTQPDARAPQNLDQMIFIAERLSADIDFVRVDLYDLGNRVMFGEMTNYPGGLSGRFHPPEWDATFGSHWRDPGETILRMDRTRLGASG